MRGGFYSFKAPLESQKTSFRPRASEDTWAITVELRFHEPFCGAFFDFCFCGASARGGTAFESDEGVEATILWSGCVGLRRRLQRQQRETPLTHRLGVRISEISSGHQTEWAVPRKTLPHSFRGASVQSSAKSGAFPTVAHASIPGLAAKNLDLKAKIYIYPPH